jgi:hypothetical protein
MKMEKISKTRWAMVAFFLVVIFVFISGCSMLEEQMKTMKELVGMAPDKDIITCTSNTETGCEGWVEPGMEATTTE